VTPASDDGYTISTDRDRLDLDVVHGFLSTEAYWSPGVARELVERSIEGSIAFGVYRGSEQVGFARVVTDRATFAWLADVFVLPGHRGRGLGKRLVAEILAHPELQGLRRWLLGTADAHDLYRRFGFEVVDNSSGRFMARETGAAARQCSGG
jgi:GNAT superfamily N-acetyltransferase